MATKAVNAKSKKLEARVPHELVDSMEKLKEEGESTAQFIISAMSGEIKRRQRKAKTSSE
ncbi:YlcI/YnfO family protein [Xenorhabdus budapestensis]|uniref:YlcI/YnfO family protein n=1 Tax=Xenorhabdus budapestensis TaxID=290110 RepID=UPI000C044523|nr:YlcI/YnfO family protein [Xenorhabdus budapestensis]